MTREEIIAALYQMGDGSYSDNEVAFDDFVELMGEVQYSADNTHTAWHFFLCGWIAKSNREA